MKRPSLAVLCSALLLILSGCAGPTHPAGGISAGDLARMQQFGGFTIYWVGMRFQHVPLTAADSAISYEPAIGMRVYYGDCEKKSSPLSSVGCRLPLEINTVVYAPHSNAGLGPHRETRLRGVPAVIYDSGRSIELYTGSDFAVDIYADSPGRALAAAASLRPANIPGAPGGGPLPRPRFIPGLQSDRQTQSLAHTLRAPLPGVPGQ